MVVFGYITIHPNIWGQLQLEVISLHIVANHSSDTLLWAKVCAGNRASAPHFEKPAHYNVLFNIAP